MIERAATPPSLESVRTSSAGRAGRASSLSIGDAFVGGLSGRDTIGRV
jgi:hypothetical protein